MDNPGFFKLLNSFRRSPPYEVPPGRHRQGTGAKALTYNNEHSYYYSEKSGTVQKRARYLRKDLYIVIPDPDPGSPDHVNVWRSRIKCGMTLFLDSQILSNTTILVKVSPCWARGWVEKVGYIVFGKHSSQSLDSGYFNKYFATPASTME